MRVGEGMGGKWRFLVCIRKKFPKNGFYINFEVGHGRVSGERRKKSSFLACFTKVVQKIDFAAILR